MTGVNCENIGNTVKNLRLEDGYWRANKETIEIFPCPMNNTCIHTNESNSTN